MLGTAAAQLIGASKYASRETKHALLISSGAAWIGAGGMGVYNRCGDTFWPFFSCIHAFKVHSVLPGRAHSEQPACHG